MHRSESRNSQRPKRRRDDKGSRRRLLLLAAYSIAMFAALFSPFDYEFPTHRERNNAVWLEDGGLQLAHKGIVMSPADATQLYRRLVSSEGFTLEMWIATADLDQGGPARIVTYSLDTALRNFTLGQDDDALVFRLRTTETDLNGARPQSVVRNVFSSLNPIHIAVSYNHTTTTVFIDGQIEARSNQPGGGFDNWDRHYRLAFGNELTGTRPWSGTFFRVAIYNRALSPEEVQANASVLPHLEQPPRTSESVALYAFDEHDGRLVRDHSGTAEPLHLVIPESVIVFQKPFLHPPYRYIDPKFFDLKLALDIAVNVGIFIPIGFILYGSARKRIERVLLAGIAVVATGVMLTFGIEIIQYFIRGRESSLGDVLHNSTGAIIGTVMAILQESRFPKAKKTS